MIEMFGRTNYLAHSKKSSASLVDAEGVSLKNLETKGAIGSVLYKNVMCS